MSYQPPSDSRRDLITHDRDAIHRTILANQRTFLSYLRTALTFFVTGVGFLKFFDSLVMEILGGLFIPIGIATFIVGIVRYNKLRVRMARMATPLHHHKPDAPGSPK
ncbi:MAG: DUF202 domain-containing protein [bacterium]